MAGHPCIRSWVQAQLMFIIFSGFKGKINWYYWIWRQLAKQLHFKQHFFWSLFNVRAMFNRYCDRLDKKQPDSVRGWLWVWLRFEPDPLPTIPHQAETQLIASQPFPVSVSGLIPSLSAAPVPCWFRKCQNQAMVTQTVWEYPHQLASQTQGLHDTPRSQLIYAFHTPELESNAISETNKK